jgi:uncharacterized protein (TIGR03067 family)
LRTRLTRRGLAPSEGALGVAPAAVPVALLDSTIRAATAGVVSARAAVLSQGVMRTMLLTRIKIAAALALVVGVFGTGAGLGAFRMLAPEPVARADDQPKPKPKPKIEDKKTEKPKMDQDKLQGIWDLTSVEIGGKDTGPLKARTSWEFKADKIVMVDDGFETKGSFKLDPGQKPKALNVPLPGRPEGQEDLVLKCVYQLEGDTLKVCRPLGAGPDRPKELATKPGQTNVLQVFKRRPADTRADRDKIQGVWGATSAEVDGKTVPGDKKTSWEFKGDKLFMTEDANETAATFKLDPDKKLKELSIVLRDVEAPALKAYYDLEGDTLKVRLPNGKDLKVLTITFRRRAGTDKGPAEVLRRRYGDKTVAILQGATKIQAFRLNPRDHVDPDKVKDNDVTRFGGYAVTATAFPRKNTPFTVRAAALLLDRENFTLDMAKGCKFEAGVGLRFWKGSERVELILCYKCSELKVIAPDPKAQGVQIPMADFGPGRTAFVKLAKELFPEDAAIQGLKTGGR